MHGAKWLLSTRPVYVKDIPQATEGRATPSVNVYTVTTPTQGDSKLNESDKSEALPELRIPIMLGNQSNSATIGLNLASTVTELHWKPVYKVMFSVMHPGGDGTWTPLPSSSPKRLMGDPWEVEVPLVQGCALLRAELACNMSPPKRMTDNITFVGRVQKNSDRSFSFDMNGVQIKTTVVGTKRLFVAMSQVGVVEQQQFQVWMDGVWRPDLVFNTSRWVPGEVMNVTLLENHDPSIPITVIIFKDSEPQFAGTRVEPNYVTFHGFLADDGAQLVAFPPKSSEVVRKVEFLGDSITAGFDNCCDVPGYHKPDGRLSSSSSFQRSWATELCNALDAECHYTAWSGFGMVRNCCGGDTLASDVWLRTLATVGSANKTDPHGTTVENAWDFGNWRADAVVINLGTNDHLGGEAIIAQYNQTYKALVVAAAKAYGAKTHFFLACGPMSNQYCDQVNWVIEKVTTEGLKASLLDQRGFINSNNTFGRPCAYGHPGSQIDHAMARSGSAFIKHAMGW